MDTEIDIKNVAIYLRKSRGEEEDLAKHQSVLLDICNKNSWKYIMYQEIGTSDSIDMRPEFLKLLREVEQELYDAVLIMDYDRLSRGDMGDQDRIKKIFQKSHTLIVTPQKIINLEDETDDMYTDFAGLIARQEYRMIKKRLKQGKKIGAKMGNWTNGTPPFPYVYERYKDKYNEKGLVVDDEKYKIYKYMVDKALQGIPPANIAYELNNMGVPGPKGGVWHPLTVYRILIDETHLGKIISNKSKGDAHKIKKASAEDAMRLPRSEWVIIPNCHQAVKTEEEHSIILNYLTKRLLIPTAARANKAEFSGLIRCGICGHLMGVQKKQNSSDILKPCRHTDEFGNKCSNKGGKIDFLHNEIKKVIIKYKDDILKSIDTNENNATKSLELSLSVKEEQLSKTKQALERVNQAYDLGDYTREEWLSRRKRWQDKILELTDKIYMLEKSITAKPKTDASEKLKIIEQFLDNIDLIEDDKDRNILYKTLIDNITWTRKGQNCINVKINLL